MNDNFYMPMSWSVSRGRDTYGYNICRLDHGRTRYRTCGGGYDMTGTVVGQWLQAEYQDKLREIAGKAAAAYSKDGGYKSDNQNASKLYGMALNKDDGSVHLDGACGLSEMVKIAAAIGITVTSTCDRKGHTIGFFVSDARVQS
jgi:hypothetical protein